MIAVAENVIPGLIEAGALPPIDCRFTPKRKAQIVNAVCGGEVEPREVKTTYDMSNEEFRDWMSEFGPH